MEMKTESKGHIAALITVIIWGITYVSTKSLLEYFTPIEILFIRFVIGYAALWLICPHLMHVNDKKHHWYFAAAGLCGVTLYYLFENIALTYTLASNVGIILSVAPFFTAIFGYLFLKDERPGAIFFVGFVIAMIGILMIGYNSEANLKLNPLGDILAIIASIIWAAYSTLSKKIGSFGYNTDSGNKNHFYIRFGLYAACSLYDGFPSRGVSIPKCRQHGQHSVLRTWSFSSMFCNLEFRTESPWVCENQCIYLHGSGDYHRIFSNHPWRADNGHDCVWNCAHISRLIYV